MIIALSGNEISPLLPPSLPAPVRRGDQRYEEGTVQFSRNEGAFLSRRLTYIRSQETDFGARVMSPFLEDEDNRNIAIGK